MSAVAERPRRSLDRSAKHNKLPKGLIFRCVIFPNATKEYSAECIDLDILAYGKTQYDAWRSLKSAIVGYLDVALGDDIAGLVPRPAPFSHRMRYHYYALRAGFTAGTRRNFLLNDWSLGPTLCKNDL